MYLRPGLGNFLDSFPPQPMHTPVQSTTRKSRNAHIMVQRRSKATWQSEARPWEVANSRLEHAMQHLCAYSHSHSFMGSAACFAETRMVHFPSPVNQKKTQISGHLAFTVRTCKGIDHVRILHGIPWQDTGPEDETRCQACACQVACSEI